MKEISGSFVEPISDNEKHFSSIEGKEHMRMPTEKGKARLKKVFTGFFNLTTNNQPANFTAHELRVLLEVDQITPKLTMIVDGKMIDSVSMVDILRESLEMSEIPEHEKQVIRRNIIKINGCKKSL